MTGDGWRALPIEGAGGNVRAVRASERLLSRLRGEKFYLAFYVYPDSVAAFREMWDFAAATGWEFGVELRPAGSSLIWGSKGSTRPPLRGPVEWGDFSA